MPSRYSKLFLERAKGICRVQTKAMNLSKGASYDNIMKTLSSI
jgi:hypothetical protein